MPETISLDKIIDLYGVPKPETVGKLPRITCRDCREARAKVCDKHKKSECRVCGNWITEKHLHLDYVGHAEVTRTLIAIDPEWEWEPLGIIDGAPAVQKVGNEVEMWGRLTLLGKTRIGVGSCEAGKHDQGKELIGDFLRNAGMRFGIALSLWSKTEWDAVVDETPQGSTAVADLHEPTFDQYGAVEGGLTSGGVKAPERAEIVHPLEDKYGTKNRALTAARHLAEKMSREQPRTFEQIISDDELVAALLKEGQ